MVPRGADNGPKSAAANQAPLARPVAWAWARAHGARVVAIVAIVVLAAVLGLVVDADALAPGALRERVDGYGWAGPAAYAGLFTVGALLMVPTTALVAVGALLFPLALALPLVWGALLVATSATFWMGRWLGRGLVERRLHRQVRRLDHRLAEHGFWAVVAMRISGLPPANVLNYASGLTRLSYRDYALGTALGVIPYVVVVVTIVNRVGSSPTLGQLVRDPLLYAAIGAVLVVLAMGRILRRRSEPKRVGDAGAKGPPP